MYTRKDAALRAIIPFVVVAGMFGFVVVAAPRYPNLAGAAMVAVLVGLVAWWIYAARHPDRWPSPKKALGALPAAGFELFWKLKDAAEAEHEPVANAVAPFRGST